MEFSWMLYVQANCVDSCQAENARSVKFYWSFIEGLLEVAGTGLDSARHNQRGRTKNIPDKLDQETIPC